MGYPNYLLRWAAEESQRREVALRMVQACDMPAAMPMMGVSGPYGADAAAHRHLGQIAGWLHREYPGLPVTGEVHNGTPVAVLARQADDAALLVVGRHEQGRLAEALFGSTAVNLTGAAGCPVVAVPDRILEVPRDDPVVLGVKGDPAEAMPALRFALHAAALATVPLRVVHYRHGDHHQHGDRDPHSGDAPLTTTLAACREEFPGVFAHLLVLDGDPAELLVWESGQASLLVLAATHGRHHDHLGRVGRAVLRHAACPVALVPAVTPERAGSSGPTPLWSALAY
jgi:nucleotide-binding universal stress UspA family protein